MRRNESRYADVYVHVENASNRRGEKKKEKISRVQAAERILSLRRWIPGTRKTIAHGDPVDHFQPAARHDDCSIGVEIESDFVSFHSSVLRAISNDSLASVGAATNQQRLINSRCYGKAIEPWTDRKESKSSLRTIRFLINRARFDSTLSLACKPIGFANCE